MSLSTFLDKKTEKDEGGPSAWGDVEVEDNTNPEEEKKSA